MQNLGASMQAYFNKHANNFAKANEAIQAAFADADVQSFLNEHRDELAEDTFERSAAKIFEFVDQKRRIEKGQPTVAPGYYPELIMEGHYVDVAYRPSEQAIQKQKRIARHARIHAVAVPKAVREATFDTLDVSADRVAIVNQVLDWVETYLANPKKYQQGLYLYGSYGIGKTYLMGAMANELADHGVQVTMMHFPSFIVEMRNSIKDNNVDTKVQQIEQAPVLIIDDIGADSMTPWSRDDILGVILEYRMQNELATFFTSNFGMTQLEREHLAETKDGTEPVKAARLMQRFRYLTKEVLMDGQNRRLGSTE
ncbi:primosomal protein DnaI [Periweissella cryptocerci]|uniref:Primosomal protein DnaI n=1 Tax=Periweissella cryptocerci TaxID=2506420 RepID=A0A4P6YSG7_9LACO|nr:primosomal protein DnaI [Periweissella cryptocerci]QBO35572.1 primosomal protein DnaI [Periweissella cryptocerci]